MTRIFIATPEYTPALPWMRASLEGVRADLHAHGVETIAPIVVTGALILAARNSMITAAERAECDAILWWDNDISTDDPTCVRAMLATGHDIIGGACPIKDNTGRVNVCLFDDVKPEGDCLEVGRIGTGFLITTMAALRKLRSAHPEREITDDAGKRQWSLFRMPIIDGHEIGEDYGLCDDWREIGGKVYAHIPTRLRHWGYHGFTGSLEIAS